VHVTHRVTMPDAIGQPLWEPDGDGRAGRCGLLQEFPAVLCITLIDRQGGETHDRIVGHTGQAAPQCVVAEPHHQVSGFNGAADVDEGESAQDRRRVPHRRAPVCAIKGAKRFLWVTSEDLSCGERQTGHDKVVRLN